MSLGEKPGLSRFEEILLDISAPAFNFNVLKHNCGRNEMEH
jgi:hypothetical protein